MDSQYICDVVPEEVRRVVIAIAKKRGIEETLIHMENREVLSSEDPERIERVSGHSFAQSATFSQPFTLRLLVSGRTNSVLPQKTLRVYL
jgi:hypothetical protein